MLDFAKKKMLEKLLSWAFCEFPFKWQSQVSLETRNL